MKKNRETVAPVVVDTGPVKEVIIRGEAIDQTEFPVPKWHYLEGGRYIHTFSAIVTRDPDTRRDERRHLPRHDRPEEHRRRSC